MRRLARILLSLLMILGIITVFLVPYLWILGSSFKTQTGIFSDVFPLSWRTFVPTEPTLDNYRILFDERGIGRALLNSLFVSLAQVVVTLMVCALAAFALTRIDFRGRDVLFMVVLVTFMVPPEALVVALYGVISDLGWQNTYHAVFLPWVASALGIFILKASFEEIPSELDEAARLDGAGHLRIFWSIILPNVRTALTTLALMTFLFSWNAFLWPLIVIQGTERQLIQIRVANSVAPGELANWGVTFAGAVVAALPLVILFLVLQRYFIRGMANSGLK